MLSSSYLLRSMHRARCTPPLLTWSAAFLTVATCCREFTWNLHETHALRPRARIGSTNSIFIKERDALHAGTRSRVPGLVQQSEAKRHVLRLLFPQVRLVLAATSSEINFFFNGQIERSRRRNSSICQAFFLLSPEEKIHGALYGFTYKFTISRGTQGFKLRQNGTNLNIEIKFSKKISMQHEQTYWTYNMC